MRRTSTRIITRSLSWAFPIASWVATSNDLRNALKGQAELKVEGRKPVRSSIARILPRDEGMVILFLFKKDQPISERDGRVVFDAKIAVFKLSQSFLLQ